MLVWKPYKTNHLKESTASGTLDCLVSRLQKHYKMTGCSMKSQSCLIMTEWGARLTFEIQTRQAATYMHALLTDTERRKLETWQRMCTHTCTLTHARAHTCTHTHSQIWHRQRTLHPPPSPAFFRTASPSTPLCWCDRGAYWMPQYELWISHSLPPPLMVTQRPN